MQVKDLLILRCRAQPGLEGRIADSACFEAHLRLTPQHEDRGVAALVRVI